MARGMTSAERQRLYRDSDVHRREAYLEKERKAWFQRKCAGKVKTVDQLTARERRAKRRYWRMAQQKSRYKFHDIISLIPQPRLIGTRHYQVEPEL